MTPETTIVFNIGASQMIVGIVIFSSSLIGFVLRIQSMIKEAVREEINPILTVKFTDVHIKHSLEDINTIDTF